MAIQLTLIFVLVAQLLITINGQAARNCSTTFSPCTSGSPPTVDASCRFSVTTNCTLSAGCLCNDGYIISSGPEANTGCTYTTRFRRNTYGFCVPASSARLVTIFSPAVLTDNATAPHFLRSTIDGSNQIWMQSSSTTTSTQPGRSHSWDGTFQVYAPEASSLQFIVYRVTDSSGNNAVPIFFSPSLPLTNGLSAMVLSGNTNATQCLPPTEPGSPPNVCSFSFNITVVTAPDPLVPINIYVPTPAPSQVPTSAPATSPSPTTAPTSSPTSSPSTSSPNPTSSPTQAPSPTPSPTSAPTSGPTSAPTPNPTTSPTPAPSQAPSPSPTPAPAPTPSTPTSAPTPQGSEGERVEFLLSLTMLLIVLSYVLF